LDRLLGENLAPVDALPLVRYGIGTAFGVQGGIKIVDSEGADASRHMRHEMGDDAAEALLERLNHEMERTLLQGPPDGFAQELGAVEQPIEDIAYGTRLDFELDGVRRLDQEERGRQGRLRDVITAREITHEWLDGFNDLLQQRNQTRGVVRHLDDQQFRDLFSCAPHIQVAISLKTAYHRNRQHRWTENDIADIDALSVAFAYCNAAFTDRAARSTLANAVDLRAFDTFLPRTPDELTAWLENLA
jgi:hypothetical protein